MIYNRAMSWVRTPLFLSFVLGASVVSAANVTEKLVEAASAGDIDSIRTLLSQGAKVNAYGKKGMTPLLAAVDQGSVPIVKLLLERGANMYMVGRYWDGDTALFLAAARGKDELVRVLLDSGADVNRPGMDGPQHY